MQKNKLSFIILTIITFYLFINNNLIQQSILEATNLFFQKIFPSLFPMLILCDAFIYFNVPQLLANTLGKYFNKLFHLNNHAIFAFFISLFSGTPSNAYVIKELLTKNLITKEEAQYLISFSFFTNPLFYLTMLNSIFTSQKIIWKLFITPYLINTIIAFILRPKKTTINKKIIKEQKENFSEFLSKSIQKSMNTLLMILGTITLFFIINTLINPNHNPLINGLLEISQGLHLLKKAKLTIKYKEILTILFVSFGGLSIHLQIKSIFEQTKISLKTFYKARLIQIILSIILIIN